MTTPVRTDDRHARFVARERWELLAHVVEVTEGPLIALAFLWLALLVLDLTYGLTGILLALHYIIWGVFILEFLLRFAIAPRKWEFLRSNCLTLLSLALPALRVLRVFVFLRYLRFLRLARAARSVSLVRIITSVNRSMRATRGMLGRRRIAYVLTVTTIVIVAGAAGMATFENPAALREAGVEPGPGEGIASFGEGLWWTTMIITSLGSQYWPRTTEGRILCVLLALYGFAVFGFITATISSILVGRDRAAEEKRHAAAPVEAQLADLRRQMDRLEAALAVRMPPKSP